MFEYSSDLLAEKVWEEYLHLAKENILLKTKLHVAEKVVNTLKEQMSVSALGHDPELADLLSDLVIDG